MRDLITDIEAGILLSDPDPIKRARNQMRADLPKRFYKAVEVAPHAGGHAVKLDGRIAKTPGRAELVLPTAAAARMVADEFAAQEEVINPVTMPVYRLANSVIDGVSREAQAVADDIVKFSSSDLLCYRADGPERLVDRENAAWNPVLAWAADRLGARFALAEGVMFVEQPQAALDAVKAHVEAKADPFRLGALHVMTTLTGSALLALAVEAGEIDAAEAWAKAHVGEDWQAELWGQDAEATARRNAKWKDMDAAARLLAAL